jgi:2-polyprenyl-3-methyl-5-hydroxy-6-metoxy-1,4-benzoquinol methylase
VSSAAGGAPRTYCLLCGALRDPLYERLTDRICGTPGEYSLRECDPCGLVWLEQEPHEEPHGDGYYTHGQPREQLLRQAQTPRLARAALAARLGYPGEVSTAGRVLGFIPPWRERCESLALFLPARAGGRLLDVGCGTGIFAARMRALGWDVTCVEPDARAASLARGTFDLTVHDGTVESAGLPAAAFDAITLSHVIEHLPDPLATLVECRRLLRPGGLLAAVTPNVGSLGRRVFGRNWLHWDVPRHRYLFAPGALAEIARRAGLEPVTVRTSARAARWAWRRSRELRRQDRVVENGAGTSRSVGAVAFELVESALAGWSGAGEESVILATAGAR